MKRIFLLLALCIFFINVDAQNRQIKTVEKPIREKEKVDEGEMKTYVLVFLKAGSNRTQGKDEAAKIQKEHLEHLTSMWQEGALLMAGPFVDSSDIKGILLMNTPEFEEAKVQVERDPAIKAGRLKAEYHKWYTKSGTVTLP